MKKSGVIKNRRYTVEGRRVLMLQNVFILKTDKFP